jgi:hypothetical protein
VTTVPTLRIANVPCSWGVIEGVEGDHGQYRRVLDEMHGTGYAGTDLGDWGFMPTDPAVRDALNALGYRGWIVVEQDILPGMGTPKESARRNRAYLASIGL